MPCTPGQPPPPHDTHTAPPLIHPHLLGGPHDLGRQRQYLVLMLLPVAVARPYLAPPLEPQVLPQVEGRGPHVRLRVQLVQEAAAPLQDGRHVLGGEAQRQQRVTVAPPTRPALRHPVLGHTAHRLLRTPQPTQHRGMGYTGSGCTSGHIPRVSHLYHVPHLHAMTAEVLHHLLIYSNAPSRPIIPLQTPSCVRCNVACTAQHGQHGLTSHPRTPPEVDPKGPTRETGCLSQVLLGMTRGACSPAPP
jgi:hypothetical protein